MAPASAHEGPPFPILMDKPAGPYVVSVWADPDIGEAQFYVVVETPDGGPPARAPKVSMWTQPAGGRLGRVDYPMQRRALRNQVQFEAEPYFDRQDFWTVGFEVVDANRRRAELTAQVESTPPGYGLWDLAIYLFPFVLLGAMWAVAMARRRRMMHGERDFSQKRGKCHANAF